MKRSETDMVTLEDFSNRTEKFKTEVLGNIPKKRLYQKTKRIFDVTVASIALVVLFIPMFIIAVIIAIDSPGNPIYRQVRLGENGKEFVIYKFRSMRVDAESGGARWASSDDPRVTKIGRFLRNTRMDELPQLVNIIRGDMSFVGPRPERPEFYDVFDSYIEGFRQRMLVKPGLTGHAQVNGGYELLPEEKILYDLEFIKKRGVLMDTACILKTVKVVIVGDKANCQESNLQNEKMSEETV